MCATGLLKDDTEHAAQMVRFAKEMQRQASQVQKPDGSGTVRIRYCTSAHCSRAQVVSRSCLPGLRFSQTVLLAELAANRRVGINSGPLLSRVIGRIHKRYCVVGSTVNIASR